MRKVDVTGWYNQGKPGGSQPEHGFQIYQVDQLVVEYAMSVADGNIAFNYSPIPFNNAHSAEDIKRECDALVEAKGLVLWLPDPVGLTMELANYMARRWSVFSEPYGHRVAIDSDLKQMEQAVRRQARDQLVAHVDFKQNVV